MPRRGGPRAVRLTVPRAAESPSCMTPLRRARRAGLVAALATLPFALAYRFALVYRVRAGYPHRHPPAYDPGRRRPRLGGRRGPVGGPACDIPRPGTSPAGPERGTGSRAHPRLGVVARPHAPPRPGAARGRVPRAHPRRPRPRRERPRGAAAVGRRVRDRRPRRASAWLRAQAGGHAGRRSSATRWAPRARSWPAADDPDIDAVVAVAAPADPARLTRQTFRLANLPIPGPDRVAARVADDARLPAAARPHGRAR